MDRKVYHDFLQTFVWSEVRAVFTRRRFWLQQDGATEHTADRVREWLEGRFGDRAISWFSGRPLPLHPGHVNPGLLALVGVTSGAADESLGPSGGAGCHCGIMQRLTGGTGRRPGKEEGNRMQKHHVQGADLHRGWWRRC